MRRHITSALVMPALGMALALGGCGPVNRGLETVNQPVVSRTDYVLDVSADALRDGAAAETDRIEAWFEALHLGYGDRVAVDDPARSADDAAHDAVAAILARHGMMMSRETPVTEGPIAPGMIRLVVSRSSAAVPDCPNWRRSSQPELAGSATSNFGCAINSNLAAMVADPEDLVRGVGTDANDPRTANKAIRAFRDAPTTGANGLRIESTKGGGR